MKSQEVKDRDKLMMLGANDTRRVIGELRQSELLVTSALMKMLEPGDRRFMALGWEDGFLVYDGWTEYIIENFSLEDIFGDSSEILALLRSNNSQCGCGSDHILIDFAQGTIYAGDETCVERFLEAVVDEQYQRSPLCVAVGSLDTGYPLDDDRCKAV